MKVRVKALKNLGIIDQSLIEGATYKEDASGNQYIPAGVEFVADWDDQTQYILITVNAVKILEDVVEKPKKGGKVVNDGAAE